ncbi:MAG TPA: alpha/beta hydrolase [Rubrivivax sp.]|nr:alpha/beta hydrolase [Rubrivivax sp.]
MNDTSDWFRGFEARDFDLAGTRIHARIGGRRDAPPLLLVHGFPQTHVMWQRVARRLAPHFRLVLPDLRGYGNSAQPPGEPDHANYSKRVMALDLLRLMQALGHERFALCGHDRGGRVAHRLALDHPQAVARLAVIDIAPTLDMYAATDMRFARAYYHWFFLIQPTPWPERMIGANPLAYLHWKLGGWGAGNTQHIEPEAMAEYERCFVRPAAIHAACEDYRASAGIDLEHDRVSRAAGQRIACDTLVLWGSRGVVHAQFDPMALWRAQCAADLQGEAMDAGHFIPEELPAATAERLLGFFA